MYGPLLSALLLGLVPMWSPPDTGALQSTHIASILPTPAPPVQIEQLPLSAFESVSASGMIIVDAETGQRIYSHDENQKRPMASLTKLMTAIIIIEEYGRELDTWVSAPDGIEDTEGNKIFLRTGDKFTIGDLLSAVLIQSANDAAITLAHFHSGSVPEFVQVMNQRATELGLRNTSYYNPTGLDAETQYSSPQDVAWLGLFAMRYPEIQKRLGLTGVRITRHDGAVIDLEHTHALIKDDSPVIAGKTGTTDNAGQCLFSIVENQERQYLVVLLDSDDRYADMRIILDTLEL